MSLVTYLDCFVPTNDKFCNALIAWLFWIASFLAMTIRVTVIASGAKQSRCLIICEIMTSSL